MYVLYIRFARRKMVLSGRSKDRGGGDQSI